MFYKTYDSALRAALAEIGSNADADALLERAKRQRIPGVAGVPVHRAAFNGGAGKPVYEYTTVQSELPELRKFVIDVIVAGAGQA